MRMKHLGTSIDLTFVAACRAHAVMKVRAVYFMKEETFLYEESLSYLAKIFFC